MQQVGAWIMLTLYCAQQENAGVIEGCKNWTGRIWGRTTGVDFELLEIDSRLWRWRGNDLLVLFYDLKCERAIQAKRLAARQTNIKLRVKNNRI
jgi:hypothetical protein